MKRAHGILLGVGIFLVGTVLVVDHLVNRMVRERFDEELDRLKTRLVVRYESMRFELWSGRVRASGVSATMADGQWKLLAESLLIRDWVRDFDSGEVVRMGVTGKGVRIHRRGGNGGWVPQMRGYGYDDPKLGLELDYQYLPESRTLVVDRLKLGGREMGALSLQGRFEDVASVEWGGLGGGTMLQRMAALGGLKVAGLQLEYHDFGLLPQVFEAHATASEKAPADIAKQVYGEVEGQKSLRLTPAMLECIRLFLEDPDRIELVLQPAKPVGTMDWATALLFRGDLIQLLGIDIRT